MARKMRDSGVEWIGEVPEGWEIKPLKSIVSCNDSVLSEETPGEYEFDYVDIGSVKYGVGIVEKERMRFSDAPSRARRVVEKGDVIVSTVRTYLKSIASIPDFKTPLIVSTGFAVLRGRDVYPSFLNFALLSQLFVDEVEARSVGISYPAINATELIAIKVVVPPLPEQRRIADYLDEKCAAIDGAVDELKRGIEDCKAWKKAIIFEAVTGKANVLAASAYAIRRRNCYGGQVATADKKNAKAAKREMRDSGIPWIGEIPEGWEVRRLKGIANIAGRIGFRGYTTADIVGEGEGALSLSPSNLNDIVMTYSKRTYISWSKYQESPEIMVFEGDIVMVKTGASYGKACIVESLPCKATLNPQLVVLKNISCERRFLNYYLQTPFSRYQADLTVVGGTIPTMSQEKMGRWLVVLPPLPEQRAIADYLDEKCAAIDALVAEKEKLIADLEAYKKSLIFELVTGKREVA